jgi:hypothetical protein
LKSEQISKSEEKNKKWKKKNKIVTGRYWAGPLESACENPCAARARNLGAPMLRSSAELSEAPPTRVRIGPAQLI